MSKDKSPQQLNNHVRIDFRVVFAMLLALSSIVLEILGHLYTPVLSIVALSFLSISLMIIGFCARDWVTTLQDRIIRLEMRLRLQSVLSESLAPRIGELTVPQLIGMRFASDAELPDLMERALSKELTRAGDIKKQVRHWEPDYLRV
jgi:hypothetical protein